MSSRRKSARIPQPVTPPEMQNKRERGDFQIQGPRKPKKHAPPVLQHSEEKRTRVVPVAAQPKPVEMDTECVAYIMRRRSAGWQIVEAVLPIHVVEGYDFKQIAGPDAVDMVLAKLCERIELRAFNEGR